MNMKRITSAQNSVYKQTVRYTSSREARKAGVFLAEGVRSVEELLKAPDWPVQSIWLSEQRAAADRDFVIRLVHSVSEDTAVYVTTDALLRRLSDTETPQGIVAVAGRRSSSLEQVLESSSQPPLFVILENLQDPGNVGTILRTADSAGAAAVLYTRGTADVYSAKVVRAAMGSLLHLPVCAVESVEQAARLLRPAGVRLLAAHLQGQSYHFEQDLTQPTAILIGNEGAGLSAEAAAQADALVKIPMPGRAESLNAAVAAGVLIYEAVRQRMM